MNAGSNICNNCGEDRNDVFPGWVHNSYGQPNGTIKCVVEKLGDDVIMRELAVKLLTRLNHNDLNQAMLDSGYLDSNILACQFMEKRRRLGTMDEFAIYKITYRDDEIYGNANIYIRWDDSARCFKGEY